MGKYEEALERAKAGKPIDEVFPELKESEDERIRKDIINLIKFALKDGSAVSPGSRTTKEEALAYLEKQKDEAQKQFNLGVQAGREEVMYEMKKEKKPAEWSEEDKEIINEVASILINDENRAENKSEEDRLAYLAERIQSIRPQPKQDWSEEDEKFIKELCNLLASIAKNNFVGLYYAPDLVSKLQSLRPQPHWKPSEEQMKALKVVVRGFPTDDPDAIDSLLTDLQKLL